MVSKENSGFNLIHLFQILLLTLSCLTQNYFLQSELQTPATSRSYVKVEGADQTEFP